MKTPSDFLTWRAARLARVRLAVEDFDEHIARSSGPGGQNVNKVSTAVTVRHVPTGISATAQDSRSQAQNRQLAWTRVLDLYERKLREIAQADRSEREKKRRQNRPRPRGVKERILQSKKHRSKIKAQRSGKE